MSENDHSRLNSSVEKLASTRLESIASLRTARFGIHPHRWLDIKRFISALIDLKLYAPHTTYAFEYSGIDSRATDNSKIRFSTWSADLSGSPVANGPTQRNPPDAVSLESIYACRPSACAQCPEGRSIDHFDVATLFASTRYRSISLVAGVPALSERKHRSIRRNVSN